MLVSVENIDGVKHTVIWYSEIDAHIICDEGWYDCYLHKICIDGNGKVIATALPPLPRNPNADDAKLLYAYVAYGLKVIFQHKDCIAHDMAEFVGFDGLNILLLNFYGVFKYLDTYKITHALDEQNNRIEIALKD